MEIELDFSDQAETNPCLKGGDMDIGAWTPQGVFVDLLCVCV